MDKQQIADLMNQVGSDKSIPHQYEIGYAQLLDRPIKNLMEIGISNTIKEYSSVWGWSKLFPTAFIYGIDIVPEKMINHGRIVTFLADQSDPAALDNVIKLLGDTKMDVIIDDGSHWFKDSSVSFNVLFDRLLAKGGIYIVEDIQKSEEARDSIMPNQQTIGDWTELLNSKRLKFETIDCVPDKNDDSLLLAIEKLV